jgi:hypothetical protein
MADFQYKTQHGSEQAKDEAMGTEEKKRIRTIALNSFFLSPRADRAVFSTRATIVLVLLMQWWVI